MNEYQSLKQNNSSGATNFDIFPKTFEGKPDHSVDGSEQRLPDFLIKWANYFDKFRLFLYLALKGRSLNRPYYAHYQITRRCNFRCGSCQTWQDKTFHKGLSLDEMRIAARNFRKIGVKCLALSGGEALLRKDIVEVVRVFRSAGLIVRLQTNGYLLTEDLLERLFRAGVADIYISLDSLDHQCFNLINGIERSDAFDRVLNSIKAAAKVSRRYGSGVFLTTVLRNHNVKEVEGLYKFAKDLGVLVGFYGIEIPPSDSQLNIRSSDPGQVPSREDRIELKKVFRRLIALREKSNTALSVSKKLLEDFRDFFDGPEGDMHWNCNAGDMYVELVPDGSISVCNATSPIDGLTYETLPEFYDSAARDGIFKQKRQSCDGCICTRQLEYITTDFSDLTGKAYAYILSLIRRTRL